MKLVILCLCLTSTASAAPSFFHYLNHYAGSRQQSQPTQVRNTHPLGLSVPPLPGAGAYSVELIYPHSYAGGANPSQPFTGYGLIKFSVPQPAGRQSVEVYYPYDFSQQRIMANSPPMSNSPHLPNVFQFDHSPQNIPQQTANVPPLDASPHPSQGPMQHIQQDQPAPTNKMPAQV
ncbi:secretory calcium-binding phosphoprotein 5 [Scomber scombrus]|uniref:Secretory calcium-binding phosphoprotein 5 n=1 Tax=Scomber scombrus TaxID=13677 RepID=A0AAV1NH81_SCOSC